MKRLVTLFVFCMACGSNESNNVAIPMCEEVDVDSFDVDSGWGADDYCSIESVNGCYPFFGNNDADCKTFISMRMSGIDAAQIDACEALIDRINCGTYSNDTDRVSFNVDTEDRLTIRMSGTLAGTSFDTLLHLNPCQPSCLAGITLQTINDEQQKVCEIPRQGLPVCLFPDTAHNVTFKEAGADRVNLVVGGTEHLLTAE